MNFISQFSSVLFGILIISISHITTASANTNGLTRNLGQKLTDNSISTSVELSSSQRPLSKKSSNSQADSFFKNGHDNYKKGNLRAALSDFNEAIRLDPKFTQAYIFRGIVSTQLQDYQGAIKDYTKAIQLNPQESFAYGGRGLALSGLKDHKKAIADYNKAIQLNPQIVQFYKYRGTSHTELKDYQNAVNDFTQAIKIQPNYLPAYIKRGDTYYQLNNYRKAIADYTQVIKIDPKYHQAYVNRSISYIRIKDFQNALRDCNQALNINSKAVECHYNKGLAYINLNKYQQAIEEYTQALKYNPKSTIAYQNRGVARTMLTDIKGGIKDLQVAANLLKQQGSTEKYQKILQVIKNLQQEHQEIFKSSSASKAYDLFSEAKLNYEKGNVKAALAKLNEAIRLHPQFAPAYKNRGIIRALSGDKQQGISDLQKAAQIYKQQGKTDEYSEVIEAIKKFQRKVKPVIS